MKRSTLGSCTGRKVGPSEPRGCCCRQGNTATGQVEKRAYFGRPLYRDLRGDDGAIKFRLDGRGQVIDQLLFYLVLVLGLFSGYLFCGQVFLREKQEGVVETLLCSPLSLREIWLGKVLGIVIPATVLSYMAAVIIVIVGSAVRGTTVVPSPPVIIHVLAVIPAFIGAGAGLMGFAELLLGMRENQILNFAIIFGLIFLISFTRELLGPAFAVTWEVVATVMMLALLIIVFTAWLTRFLSRERIVTTLPD